MSGAKAFDAMLSALNAVENASRVPVRREDIVAMLATGQGEASQLRALFGDVDLHTLLRLATMFGVDDPTLVRAYDLARRSAAAANAELDEYAATYGV